MEPFHPRYPGFLGTLSISVRIGTVVGNGDSCGGAWSLLMGSPRLRHCRQMHMHADSGSPPHFFLQLRVHPFACTYRFPRGVGAAWSAVRCVT
jgi:hypothetical protein